MSDTLTGFRAFPPRIEHPRFYRHLSLDEFKALDKTIMQSAQPLCDEHLGTNVWHCDQGYVVQVRIKDRPDTFVVTPCTISPDFGMDAVDGLFAQDAEDYVLLDQLGRESLWLKVFGEDDSLDTAVYLELRGIDNVT